MTPPSERAPRPELIRAIDEVRAELTRIDSKANTLATVAGLLLAAATALFATNRSRPVTAVSLAWVGIAVMCGSLLLLLWAIRPALDRDPAAFTSFATPADEASRETSVALAATPLADHLQLLSKLTLTKYKRVRLATDLLVTGTLALGGALILACTL